MRLFFVCAGVKALKKMNGLQAWPNNSYGGAYGMASFGVPLGATSFYSMSMPVAMPMAAPVSWQPPVELAPSQPSAAQPLPLLLR